MHLDDPNFVKQYKPVTTTVVFVFFPIWHSKYWTVFVCYKKWIIRWACQMMLVLAFINTQFDNQSCSYSHSTDNNTWLHTREDWVAMFEVGSNKVTGQSNRSFVWGRNMHPSDHCHQWAHLRRKNLPNKFWFVWSRFPLDMCDLRAIALNKHSFQWYFNIERFKSKKLY